MDLRKLFIGSIALIIMLSLGCSGGGANDIGEVGEAAETMWEPGKESVTDRVNAAKDEEAKAAGITLVEIGQPAPSFELSLYENENHADGEQFSLEQVQGKPTVIFFFFPSCYECGDVLQFLKEHEEDNPGEINIVGVDVLIASKKESEGVSIGSGDEGKTMAKERGMNFPVGGDVTETIRKAYSIAAYPTAIFLDKNHTVTSIATYLRPHILKENIRQASK